MTRSVTPSVSASPVNTVVGYTSGTTRTSLPEIGMGLLSLPAISS